MCVVASPRGTGNLLVMVARIAMVSHPHRKPRGDACQHPHPDVGIRMPYVLGLDVEEQRLERVPAGLGRIIR